jgi:cystathionine beta-lyase/cystathionine gamma-synthase
MMGKEYKRIETKIIRAGEPHPRLMGAVSMPIFQTAMFETFGGEGYHNVKYIRLNNTPNHDVLHDKLAALENAERGLVTASGMAAISASLLTVLSAGDHFLCQNSLYGGTDSLITRDLPKLGIEYDFIDLDDPGSWESKLRPNTKALYVESISNPLMRVGDLKGAADFAKAHNLVSMIDNTFTSPINFRPIEWGYDVSLHSCTKYLNGHSDLVAGAAIGNAEWIDRIKLKLDHLGGTLDPHTCFLLHRGLKTLALRMRYQNESAVRIAEFLDGHPRVEKVNYPGLKNSNQYARASELFDGFGGMLSYELKGGLEDVDRFLRSVSIPVIAPSLGGVETLLTRPASTSHASLTSEDLDRSGISETLIRMSVGIESTEDIIEDLEESLSK